MESEATTRIYELAYHLSPDLDESGTNERVGAIEKIITDLGGSITLARPIRKLRLSYPINHTKYAQMGILDFNAEPSTVKQIEGQLKLTDNIIRYLIISKEDMAGKEVRMLGDQRARRRPTHSTGEQATTEEKVLTPEQEAKKEQAMEEEIADVLEDIEKKI